MFNFFKKKNKGIEVDAVVDGDIMPKHPVPQIH